MKAMIALTFCGLIACALSSGSPLYGAYYSGRYPYGYGGLLRNYYYNGAAPAAPVVAPVTAPVVAPVTAPVVAPVSAAVAPVGPYTSNVVVSAAAYPSDLGYGYGYPASGAYGYPASGAYGYPASTAYTYPASAGYAYPSAAYGYSYGYGYPGYAGLLK